MRPLPWHGALSSLPAVPYAPKLARLPHRCTTEAYGPEGQERGDTKTRTASAQQAGGGVSDPEAVPARLQRSWSSTHVSSLQIWPWIVASAKRLANKGSVNNPAGSQSSFNTRQPDRCCLELCSPSNQPVEPEPGRSCTLWNAAASPGPVCSAPCLRFTFSLGE